jgi:hypothetical protein
LNKYQDLLDNCTGPVPKPPLKPKPLTGIQKQIIANLEEIQDEYLKEFGKQ